MEQFSRRVFLGTAAASSALAAAACKMTIQLSPGAIGIKADQAQTLDYAVQYGFTSIEPFPAQLAAMSGADFDRLQTRMKQANIVWGASGLPVEFRQSEERFTDDLKKLPALSAALQKAGVTRVSTWILPASDNLTYVQNLDFHARRLKEVAAILGGNGQRLGLEFVGPKTAWTSKRYPFVHSLREMKDLIAVIGKPNVGLLLDSWHWFTAGDTTADLRSLTNAEIVSVDLNDAPAGIAIDQQRDNVRELPGSTGVIDIATFLNTLNDLGCDAPVRCEPFNDPLRKMPPAQALQTTIDAMKKAFATIRS
jgi:sugar phosphate isomerase/epimerase